VKKSDVDPTEQDIAAVSAAADRLDAAAEALDGQRLQEYWNFRYPAEWAATLAELLPRVPAVVAKLDALQRAHAARLERELAKLDRLEVLKRATPAVAQERERLRRLIQSTLQTLKDAARQLERKAAEIRGRDPVWLKSWSLPAIVQADRVDLEGRLGAAEAVELQLATIKHGWAQLRDLVARSGDTVLPAPEQTIPDEPRSPARSRTVLDEMSAQGRLPS
jgi:hypothetical protein